MQFLYPNVLFFILVPVLLLMYLILTNKDNFQKHFSKEALSKLSISNKYMNKTTRNTLFFISLILMIIALARPVINEKQQSFKQEISSIVIAIDVSKSMLATDLYPNRLTMAKRKLLDIIELSKQNALAVVLFAKSSFILSPITQDFNSLKILVENLNTGINFDNGSNIFSTLETTNKLLKDYKNKNLLLLTDGGNNSSYKEEIEYAKKNRINIYTLALATKKASPIKLEDGNFLTNKDGSIVTVALNETIKDLSLGTNGGYINYSISNNDIKQILSDIDKKSLKEELRSKKFKTYTELFYFPLALAIFILLIAFSSLPNFITKRVFNILFLSFFIGFNSQLKAFEFDFKTIDKANSFYKNKEYEKASKNFKKVTKTPEGRYNYANSLYKQKKYKEALNQYKEVTTSNQNLEYKKLHNMGNTYVKLKDLENAKKMYENALKIKEDTHTKENLEIVEKLLNQKNKQENNKQNQDNKNQKEKKKQNNQQEKKQKQNNNEKNKKNKEEEEANKKEEKKQNEQNSNKENQKKEEKEKQNNTTQNKKQQEKIESKEISDLEEKKWLNKINNRKTPVLLKRVETKNQDNSSNPW